MSLCSRLLSSFWLPNASDQENQGRDNVNRSPAESKRQRDEEDTSGRQCSLTHGKLGVENFVANVQLLVEIQPERNRDLDAGSKTSTDGD